MSNVNGAFDIPVDGSGGILPELSVWESFQARVFGWNNNSTFFNSVPYQWQNYYRNTLYPCINFAQGYDPTVHGLGKLISTRTGCVVIRTIVDQIMSGDVQFEDRDGESDVVSDFMSEWATDARFVSFLYKLVTFSVSGGTALSKINVSANGMLWFDALRVDRYYADVDSSGNVTDVKCYISVYEETIPDAAAKNWFLVEHRFYKNEIPYVKYTLQPLEGLVNSPVIPNDTAYPWEAVPENVRRSFMENYGTARLGEEIELPFETLGCSLVKNTETSIIVPDIRFGDSSIMNILPALIGIDQAYTNMINDQYIGAGWVYTPASVGDAIFSDGTNKRLRQIPTVDGSTSQKAEAVQFNLRIAEWEAARDMYLRMIASAEGISANTLSSHLASDSANKTVAEIASENNKTTNMVENKRRLISSGINPQLKEVLRFYGIKGDVKLRFSKSGLTNMRNLVELVIMKYQAGLLSLKEAIKDLNPDWNEAQINAEVAELEKRDQVDLGEFYGYSEPTAEFAGDSAGGGGNKDQDGGER